MSSTAPYFSACSTSDSRSLLRERQWTRGRRDTLSLLSDILDVLRAEHASGSITIHLNQGSATTCTFSEKVGLDELSS